MKVLSKAILLSLVPFHANAAGGEDCSTQFCDTDLADGFKMKYKINVPQGTSSTECAGCTMSVEMYYDGDAWIALGLSTDGQMVGSDAVIGIPGSGVSKYFMAGQATSLVTKMPESQQTLTDSSVEFDGTQTVMKFTMIMDEPDEVPVVIGDNTFLYAYGSSPTLDYHAGRSPFVLNLSIGSETSGMPDANAGAIAVGDEVCITGYIMDQFCINRGTFLDDSNTETLKFPEKHSFHCLLDVPVCQQSGYTVLGPKNEATGEHCIGYRIHSDDTQKVLDVGFPYGNGVADNGYCTGCTGDDSRPSFGWVATVKGTVVEMGQENGENALASPVIGSIEILDNTVKCETSIVPPTCGGSTGPVPAVPPTPSQEVPVPAPEPAAPTPAAKDCTAQFCNADLAAGLTMKYMVNVPQGTNKDACTGCTMSVEMYYDGDAWIALGLSTDGQMVGSDTVIGIPGSGGGVSKYALDGKTNSLVTKMPASQQTLTDTSVAFDGTQTVMKFTKLMSEPGEVPVVVGDNTFLYAYGSSPALAYHAGRSSFALNLSSGSSQALQAPNKAAWLAHGIMAFLAWGVLVPFAVESSLYRSLLPPGGLWYKLHRFLNSFAYALNVAAFAVAVAYTDWHFDGVHKRMGLAMLILATLQVAAGVFRPHAPEGGEAKTSARTGFEVGHRLLGAALLACGFWQMQRGIQLYAARFQLSGETKVTIAYWVWIGLMSALIVFGAAWSRGHKSAPAAETPAEKEEDADA